MRFSKAMKTGAGLVRLADGSLLSVVDLPPRDTRRWVASCNWQWCGPYFINYGPKKKYLKPTAAAKKNFMIGCGAWRQMVPLV